MKNRALHSGIKMSPYEALFGCKVKVGLSTSNLPKEVVDNLENEEQLLEIFEKYELKYDDPILPDNSNHYANIQENSIQDTIPTIQSNNANAMDNRKKAKENLENQAVKMKTWSDKNLNQLK